MKIVIPCAGSGARFVERGYADPKPLIRLACDNRRIIEHVLDMFTEPDDRFIFICSDVHLATTEIRTTLLTLRPEADVISIKAHKKGPVFTVQQAFPFIDDHEEVIVSYCDGTLRWDSKHFASFVRDKNLDGCLFTHTGFHPHTLSSTRMAFLREHNGLVEQIKEKACYTDNPEQEHASSGVYYFRRGEFVKKYFAQMLQENLHYNGEYYVTLAYNLLIKDKLRVGFYDTPFVTILGTPETVQNFDAWSHLVRNTRLNHADLAKCYDYWKAYWDNHA